MFQDLLVNGDLANAGVSLLLFAAFVVGALLLSLLGVQLIKWSSVLSAHAETAKKAYQNAHIPDFVRDGIHEGVVAAKSQVDQTTDPAIIYATKTIQNLLTLAHLSPNTINREQVRDFAMKVFDQLLDTTSPIAPPPDKV